MSRGPRFEIIGFDEHHGSDEFRAWTTFFPSFAGPQRLRVEGRDVADLKAHWSRASAAVDRLSDANSKISTSVTDEFASLAENSKALWRIVEKVFAYQKKIFEPGRLESVAISIDEAGFPPESAIPLRVAKLPWQLRLLTSSDISSDFVPVFGNVNVRRGSAGAEQNRIGMDFAVIVSDETWPTVPESNVVNDIKLIGEIESITSVRGRADLDEDSLCSKIVIIVGHPERKDGTEVINLGSWSLEDLSLWNEQAAILNGSCVVFISCNAIGSIGSNNQFAKACLERGACCVVGFDTFVRYENAMDMVKQAVTEYLLTGVDFQDAFFNAQLSQYKEALRLIAEGEFNYGRFKFLDALGLCVYSTSK